MKIRLHVENEVPDQDQDQVFDVVSDSRDVRKYEEAFSTSWINTELSITQMAQLAWVTLRRQGLYEGDWPSFDKINIDVTSKVYEQGEVEAGNPT